MKTKKLLSILLTICMVTTLLPVSALADGTVSYLYYADEAAAIAGTANTGSCTDYTVVSNQTAWGEAGQTKWYVVNSSVTIADRITVSGDVHLILSNGCTLTASKGIGVTGDNSLTIYGQSADESAMGAIEAQLGIQNGYNYLAAIGGGGSQNSSGQITVNGGKITATGGTNAAGIGGGKDESGTVTINGGFITATSQYNNATPGAAIGGGYNGSGTVTINGGHVVATGGQSSAGIGSGYAASATVTINGGIIEAHGGAGAAGIGSGKYWYDTSTTRQATVFIHGGTVVADTKSPMYNTDGSAAIGGGAHSQGFVTIDGGHVTATAPKNCTCIGNYEVNYRQTGSVTITGGVITAQLDSSVQASDTYYGIGGAGCSVTLGWTDETDRITSPKWGGTGNSTVSFAEGKSFQYEDTHTLAEAASLRDGATLIPFVPAQQLSVDQADVSDVRAWYPYTGSAIEPDPVVTYSGAALTKGTDYTLSYTSDHTSIGEKAVTITGQGNYAGTKTIYYQIVEASTTYLDDAGSSQTCTTFQCLDQSDTTLSAGWYLVYDNLTINNRVSLTGDVNLILKDGKTLTSVKGISVPGTASLTIYAQSNIESTAGKLLITDPEMFFSGIGNDYKLSDRDSHGNITIVGGVIEAKGGISGAAIGSALSASQGGNIVIKGGFVTANGTGGGAGIGSGANTDGGIVTINGGKVTATSIGGAAIGSGGFGDGKGSFGAINITGGTISAKSESGGAGIGGGSNGAGGTISITGGTVTASASGDTGGAGIGGGKNAAGGSITIHQNAIITKATANAGAGIGSGGGETTGTTTIIIGTSAKVTNAASSEGAGIGSGKNSSAACSVTIKDGANVKAGSTLGAGIGGGNGASNFSVTIEGGTVNAWAGGIGIQDGNGDLSAYGGAAIGGGANANGGTVSISGGTVTARAIGGGAGIGSGTNAKRDATETNSGSITISGGTVTAAATHRAAGIGGGRRSNGGTITINGGTITANGSDAAGIGHGGEDTLWEGQGSFYVPIVDDPTQDVGGAYYDSIVPIDGTNKATTDGTVTFTYADDGTVSITASSYPSSPTLSKAFKYSDTEVAVVATYIADNKTIVSGEGTTHTHSFTYAANGATITATCSAASCPLTNSQATLTIAAPTSLTYDGTAKAATVTGDTAVLGTPSITYTKQGDNTFSGTPTDAGSYTASITLGSATASVTADITAEDEPAGWESLQALLSGDAETVTLKQDYTATADNSHLEVPEDRTVTLDLNGHKIDGSAVTGGSTLHDWGTLTLTDSTGGGELIGSSEGALLVGGGSSFTVSGGKITADNTAYGAVCVSSGAVFTVSGAPAIGSVYLGSGAVITIGGELQWNTPLPVKTKVTPTDDSPVTITSGLSGNGSKEQFASADPRYDVVLNDSGEAELRPSQTAGTDGEIIVSNNNPVTLGNTYAFIPEDGGAYVFYSVGAMDTVGTLYLGENEIANDDDSGEGNNFRISALLDAGSRCRLCVRGNSDDDNSKTCTVVVEYRKVQTISFASATQEKTYGDADFTVTATGAKTSVSYQVTKGEAATVDSATGAVHIVKAGTATITATAEETRDYTSATASYTLTVNPKSVAIPTAASGLKWTGSEQTGVADGEGYTVTDGAATAVGSYTATATLTSTVNYQWSDGTTDAKSIPWSIAKADGPAAPTGLAGIAPTTAANNDGKITGITAAMEYKRSDADTWTEGTGADIIGLTPGTYYVRVKATDTTLASDNQTLTVAGYVAPGQVAAPTFDPPAGTYSAAQNVTISCLTDGATIHYTTDGTVPTESSPTYSAPISVSATATIKAIAVKSGMTNSSVAEVTYTINTALTTYAVTVNNGTGDGNYAPGTTVTITADAPASGKVFDKWISNDGLTFAKETSATTTFVMPAKDVTVTATYKSKPAPTPGGDPGPSPTPDTTITIPVSGDDETVNITVTIKGETATITSAIIDKVLNAEDVGTVIIDASTLKQEVTAVVIPGAMVEKIADAVADEGNDADGLEIKLPTGTVTFDAEAVAAISQQANGKDLRLNLENIGENKLNTAQKTAVEAMDVQEVLDVYMTADGQRISDFQGGKATVTVSYTLKDGQTGHGVVVWYVAEDGEKTAVSTTYNDKSVTFTVGHFSNYVIAYDAERAAACPKDDTCPMSSFTDLDLTQWYHDGIHFCLENGLMVGVGDNRFGTNGPTSRAMIVTILYRLEGEPEVTAEIPFNDVEAGTWYTDAVIWAAENEIVSGYGNGKFGPNDHITREQLAAILYRYAQVKGTAVSPDQNIMDYEDVFDVSPWASEGLRWAVQLGIVQGVGNHKLAPKGDATRAQAAAMIQRFCEATK